MKWETVIGLEVHAELSTKSKIFCACTTAYGGEPNTHVCPVCSGMPGTLPTLNRAVVEYALRVGLALGCTITKHCRFDRKNYFYPDLPKAYQVSQFHSPIGRNGRLGIEVDGQARDIGISEIHMEEDSGKLIHDRGGTYMDFNRCGVPLLEIVSRPDFRNAAEVIAYLEKLRETLMYLDVCDCKMQEGSLRADVNISVRPAGGEMGVRTEMKNINSFKAIRRAIEHETMRQIQVLESGGQVAQETRRWDDGMGRSFAMRSKENAPDYRYFPEPDLPPIHVDDAWLDRIKRTMPEPAWQKRERYVGVYGLSEYDASVLTTHRNISRQFESLAEHSGEPVESARLVTGEIMRLMNGANIQPENLNLDIGKFSTLVSLVVGGRINRGAYKETAEAVFTHNLDPENYIAENGLAMLDSGEAIDGAVDAVLAGNANAVAEYRAGKTKVFGFLMGQVMEKLGGAGNPDTAKKSLAAKLDEFHG